MGRRRLCMEYLFTSHDCIDIEVESQALGRKLHRKAEIQCKG